MPSRRVSSLNDTPDQSNISRIGRQSPTDVRNDNIRLHRNFLRSSTPQPGLQSTINSVSSNLPIASPVQRTSGLLGSAMKRKTFKPKKRRVLVLKDIKKLQSSGNLLLPKLPFQRLVKEIVQEVSNNLDYKMTAESVFALQEATEAQITNFFEMCTFLTLHAGRITLMNKDFVCLHVIMDAAGAPWPLK